MAANGEAEGRLSARQWRVVRRTAIALGCLLLAGGLFVTPLAFIPPTAEQDTDRDGTSDIRDDDADNDGVLNANECEGTDAAALVASGATEPQLRPSHFGIAPGEHVSGWVTRDLSEQFGQLADSGAVVVTVYNATRHPGGDDIFISGVNPQHPGGATRVQFTGTLGVYVTVFHDSQWFAGDIKTITTNDGTKLTDALALTPSDEPRLGIHTADPGAHGTTYTIIGPEAPAGEFELYPSMYVSEVQETDAGDLGFASITTDFSFESTLAGQEAWPVVTIVAHTECDSDDDGVGDRLQPAS